MLKSKDLLAKRANLDEVLAKVERNEEENADFKELSDLYKRGEISEGLTLKVILNLLDRMRRLEQRVRELEGD